MELQSPVIQSEIHTASRLHDTVGPFPCQPSNWIKPDSGWSNPETRGTFPVDGPSLSLSGSGPAWAGEHGGSLRRPRKAVTVGRGRSSLADPPQRSLGSPGPGEFKTGDCKGLFVIRGPGRSGGHRPRGARSVPPGDIPAEKSSKKTGSWKRPCPLPL